MAGTLLGSPFLTVEWRTVLNNVALEARPYHLGSVSEDFLSTLWWYLEGW